MYGAFTRIETDAFSILQPPSHISTHPTGVRDGGGTEPCPRLRVLMGEGGGRLLDGWSY